MREGYHLISHANLRNPIPNDGNAGSFYPSQLHIAQIIYANGSGD